MPKHLKKSKEKRSKNLIKNYFSNSVQLLSNAGFIVFPFNRIRYYS